MLRGVFSNVIYGRGGCVGALRYKQIELEGVQNQGVMNAFTGGYPT